MKKNINRHQFYGKSIPQMLLEAQSEINVACNHRADNGFPTQHRTGLRRLLWRLMLRFR